MDFLLSSEYTYNNILDLEVLLYTLSDEVRKTLLKPEMFLMLNCAILL